MAEAPEMVKILDVRADTPAHRTFTLDKKVKAKPGQFCMLWLPGLDEKPMSFSGIQGNLAVTVKKVGKFTEALFKLKKGDLIGFRGPYGNSFTPVNGRALVVGGGCGIAPLMPLVRMLASKGNKIVMLAGSRTREDCLLKQGTAFRRELARLGKNVLVETTTDHVKIEEKPVPYLLKRWLASAKQENKPFTMAYACGPEVMMKAVLDLCNRYGIPTQLSLERIMNCGIGICGSCMLSTLRVCKDGPVFAGKHLSGTEFGQYTRNAEGRRTHIQ